MRLALLTLESLGSDRAIRSFVRDNVSNIVLIGISNPYRKNAGGAWGQMRKRIAASGLHILPYLAANFTLPKLLASSRLWKLFPNVFEPPITEVCKRLKIPFVIVDDVNDAPFHERLRSSTADMIVTFHFDQILSVETIAVCPRGGFNVHPSLLPMHRGPIPTYHALSSAVPRFGTTIHRLAAVIDAGPILMQKELTLTNGVTVVGAAQALHELGAEMLRDLLSTNIDTAKPEEWNRLPYCSFPNKAQLRSFRAQGHRMVALSDLRHVLKSRAVRERINRLR